ncbi:hypothetical protein O3P69_008964 [Scylla paramamosain]|uniref:Uncharacterized protein n=1 Tax=Scylla paramamosain TaxID=85552 RepID=A0AAW0TSJ0_SCYPA
MSSEIQSLVPVFECLAMNRSDARRCINMTSASHRVSGTQAAEGKHEAFSPLLGVAGSYGGWAGHGRNYSFLPPVTESPFPHRGQDHLPCP